MTEGRLEGQERFPVVSVIVGLLGGLGIIYAVCRFVWILQNQEELVEGSFAASGLLEMGIAVLSIFAIIYSIDVLKERRLKFLKAVGKARPGDELIRFDGLVPTPVSEQTEVYASNEGLFLRPTEIFGGTRIARGIEKTMAFVMVVMFYSFITGKTEIWDWAPLFIPFMGLRIFVGVFEMKAFLKDNAIRQRFKEAAAHGEIGVDTAQFVPVVAIGDLRWEQIVPELRDKLSNFIRAEFGEESVPKDWVVSKEIGAEEVGQTKERYIFSPHT